MAHSTRSPNLTKAGQRGATSNDRLSELPAGRTMLSRIFPKSFDNAWRGRPAAIWILAAVSLAKTLQGVMSMVNTRHTMITADAIPVDKFPPEAAREAVAMFALLGLNLTVLPLIGLVAMVRYRSMVPFVYLMMIAVAIGYRVLNAINDSTDYLAKGFLINMAILAVTVVGFVLSLMQRSPAPERAP